PPAQIEATTLRIRALHNSKKQYFFSASGSVLIFDGFLRIWPSQMTEKKLPRLTEGEPLSLLEAKKERHETEPPPRYTEASLVKALEQHGVGRPSTYAPIISVIQERNYVEKSKGKFYLTELGEAVNKLLVTHFPEIVDLKFTAQMEENLDKIAAQKMEWREVVRAFYQPFIKRLEEKYATVQKTAPQERTDEICKRCGKRMEVKFGKFGKFLACSGFPDCTYTQTMKAKPKSTGLPCPACIEDASRKAAPGEIVERFVRRGRAKGKKFWGCSRYPECNYSTWENPTSHSSPKAPKPPTPQRKS
ncbi:DNA topoisomerase I, partial [Candidatus Parcubacteria bacterium]